MDILLVATAFVFGVAARSIGLPPLVGYLAAGFGLHALGVQESAAISTLADLGIGLLLFGIGLKLRPRVLLRAPIIGTASAFALVGTLAVAGLLLMLGSLGIPVIVDLDLTGALVVGFAGSFCSTVFTVKVLEESNESKSLVGRVAIGVLVLQDILAVGFLVVVGSDRPSAWALLLIPGLAAARSVGGWLLDRLGHDETLVLFGIVMALGVGVEAFALAGLKPDLGALVAGALLAGHRRAPELAGRLLDIKDLLLIGFFLSLGLQGIPTAAAWTIGLALVLLVPLRTLLLIRLFTWTRLRSRTAFHTSLSLSTYSEFGLIVIAAALAEGLVGEEWIAVIAVAVGVSFVTGSVAMRQRYPLHDRISQQLSRLDPAVPAADDAVIDVADARVLVFGMGRVGTGAYDELVRVRGGGVLGVDHDVDKVISQQRAERAVILGNTMDADFWDRVRLHDDIELVVAAMGPHQANLECVRRARQFLPAVPIAAVATYPDQVAELREAGCDIPRYLFDEAGQALADDAIAVVYPPPS